MPRRTPSLAYLAQNEAIQVLYRTNPEVCRRSLQLVSITIQRTSPSWEGRFTIHRSVFRKILATDSRSLKRLSKQWASARRFPSFAHKLILLTFQRPGMELYRLDQEHLELSLQVLVREPKVNLDRPNEHVVRNAAGTITSNQSALIIPRFTLPCVFLLSKSERNQLQLLSHLKMKKLWY